MNYSCLLGVPHLKSFFAAERSDQHEITEGICRQLGYGYITSSSPIPLEMTFDLEQNHFAIGGYVEGFILVNLSAFDRLLEKDEQSVIDRMRELYPDIWMYYFEQCEQDNYCAYALHHGEKLIRTRVSDAERGIVIDKGDRLDEEQSEFMKEVNGRSYFQTNQAGKTVEVDEAGLTEIWALEISRRIFGTPIYSFDEDMLIGVESLKRRKRLFGGIRKGDLC